VRATLVAGYVDRVKPDVSGSVELDLAFNGDIAAHTSGGTSSVIRKPGSTHITGTATSSAGVFTVDVSK
jgi:hypothetical protein